MFRELGATVVDADEASHEVYAPGSPGFDAVVSEFGPEYVRDGRIDRERLGELIFQDEDARHRLNAIVHPLVRLWMSARTIEAERDGADVVIHDVPLLFENGLQDIYSDVVLAYVPKALQLRRLVEGRGLDKDRAEAIIASQTPIEEKRGRAQHIIDNSGSREATREQVKNIWAEVSAR